MGTQVRIFAAADDAPPPANATAVTLLGGFATAAATAWILVSILRLPAGLPSIAVAVIHIVLIAAASVLGIHVVRKFLQCEINGIENHSAAVAAWLAPLAVYWESGSTYAIPMAAVFAAEAAPVFKLC